MSSAQINGTDPDLVVRLARQVEAVSTGASGSARPPLARALAAATTAQLQRLADGFQMTPRELRRRAADGWAPPRWGRVQVAGVLGLTVADLWPAATEFTTAESEGEPEGGWHPPPSDVPRDRRRLHLATRTGLRKIQGLGKGAL